MRFGISRPAFADFSDPRMLTELARDAENAGVTWWIESIDPFRLGWRYEVPWAPDAAFLMREYVHRGPPSGLTCPIDRTIHSDSENSSNVGGSFLSIGI